MDETTAKTNRNILSYLYGIYAWVVFIVCVIPVILAAAILPGLSRRRRVATIGARTAFSLCGISLTTSGFENIPSLQCVVVANHASYIDGVILQAVLPPQFSYVIKKEARKIPFMGFLLHRVGAKFVDRFTPSGSARDARKLIRAAGAGEALAFFPEGTFLNEAGLARFRAGAFAAAINSQAAIVPLVIFGSRHILRGGTILPRHGNLRIEALPAIQPDDIAFESTRSLSNLARNRILEVLDEPDLLENAN